MTQSNMDEVMRYSTTCCRMAFSRSRPVTITVISHSSPVKSTSNVTSRQKKRRTGLQSSARCNFYPKVNQLGLVHCPGLARLRDTGHLKSKSPGTGYRDGTISRHINYNHDFEKSCLKTLFVVFSQILLITTLQVSIYVSYQAPKVSIL